MPSFDFSRFVFNIDTSIFNFGPGVLFFLLGVVFVLVWGLSLGRTRALVSLLAIYIAYVLEIAFPYLAHVSNIFGLKAGDGLLRIGIFFAAYIVVFAILNSSLVKVRLSMKESSVVIVGLISMLQLGLLISIIFNTLPATMLKQIPPSVMPFFSGNQALFFWFLLPVIALLFIRKD